ncbi:phosphate butyryltransferase [Staphylococcus sp. ACRSN]|uniref:phosphate acyltransferase n=1 Tax=Staphylococcus sp. ACRSN TaxID=2918214 RepID=UPI001EF34E4D|nr:phosphate acyltransferase [Staphylococcus sp. ACRSN]MCG7339708.1 phosphate butyryltransferase [Staphylococcus sp. ACRSN]
MQYQHLVEPTQALNGKVAVLFANDEKIISVLLTVLKQTNIELHLYDIEDPTELIRSYNIDSTLITRVHTYEFESEQALFNTCSNDLAQGKVNVLMKGNIEDNKMFAFILSNHQFIERYGYLNHVACIDLPHYHKHLMLSDAYFNVAPTVEEKKQIIKNLQNFAQSIGYKQLKVALLSSVNFPNRKIKSATEAEKIKLTFERIGNNELLVGGPLTFEYATNMESVIKDNFKSEIAGDVDAIVVANKDVGDPLYKALTLFGQARIASLIIGAKFPIVLNEISASKQSKIDSLLLALKINS